MSEEEIIKQYANGIVDIDELVGSLIDKFKTDKTSVDIQQLQLIAEYLIYKADKLQKENEEYQELTDNLRGENAELRDDLDKLQKELEKANKQMDLDYVDDNFISKDKIRNKIKEVAEEPQIYVDTEKFDKEFEKSNYIIEVLEELLGE